MNYSIALTHDIDVLSLAEIPWRCKTLWGFAFRCIQKALGRRHKISWRERLSLAWSGLSTPLIKLGLADDPWKRSLQEMLTIERKYGVRSTLYFIPFSGQPGRQPNGQPAPSNRAAHYNLELYRPLLRNLAAEGWEIGVHGIDAYWDLNAAKNEINRIKTLAEVSTVGVRMHWLYSDFPKSWDILREAGYAYDTTLGWNDQIGFPENRYLPFKPIEGSSFTVLPLNIQDGALFDYQNLSDDQAWVHVEDLIDHAPPGTVITVLWHNSSFVPPRSWEKIYERIIAKALSEGARIGCARDFLQ